MRYRFHLTDIIKAKMRDIMEKFTFSMVTSLERLLDEREEECHTHGDRKYITQLVSLRLSRMQTPLQSETDTLMQK